MDFIITLNEGISQEFPPGLKFLKGPKQTEKVTIDALDKCCREHNTPEGKCVYDRECQRWQSIRAGNDSRFGGWGWKYKDIYRVPMPKRQTDSQKYARSLPQLSRRTLISMARERPIY